MALSNWDMIAFNNEGKPCNGVFANSKGDHVEIYKNWLHVRSPSHWREGYSFVEPTIAQIDSGAVNVAGFKIWAARGRQNSVLALITHFEYGKDEKGKDWYKTSYFGGIGCYGFNGDDWVGVDYRTLEEFYNFLVEDVAKMGGPDVEYDTEYKNWADKVKNEEALRFNQGDAYFASVLNLDTPATNVGKQRPPIIMKMLKDE